MGITRFDERGDQSGLIIGGEVAGDSITSVNGLAVMPTKESLIHHWI